MKKKLVKALEFLAVVVALIIGVLVGKNISLESMLKKNEQPVTLSMTEGGIPEDYIGKPAAEDIPRIEDLGTWEETWTTSYITVEPKSIVPTGIGVRYPWIPAYSNSSRRGGPRKKADIINTKFDIFNEYGEYYLLQLPDDSYILGEIPMDDARKLKAGESVTLPVGRKQSADSRVVANITNICAEYDVDTEDVFYCIDEKWSEEHNFMLLLMRFGVGAVVVLVLGTILITIVDKVFKVKDA